MIKLVDTKASDLLGGGEFLCSKTKSNYYSTIGQILMPGGGALLHRKTKSTMVQKDTFWVVYLQKNF